MEVLHAMRSGASAVSTIALAVLILAAACDEDHAGPGSEADGGDLSVDGGADTDDCSPVSWGSGFEVGHPVANWTQSGYVDSNGDLEVEQVEVDFDLVDVNCAGHDAIVLLIGDTT